MFDFFFHFVKRLKVKQIFFSPVYPPAYSEEVVAIKIGPDLGRPGIQKNTHKNGLKNSDYCVRNGVVKKKNRFPYWEILESIPRVSLGDDIDASPFFLPPLRAHSTLKYIGAILQSFVARKSCANHRILKLPYILRFLKLPYIWRQTGIIQL